MTEIGEQGERFNFSSASRAAHFRPDIDRIRRYDPYRQKYVRLTRIVQGIGLLTAGLSLRLWTTDHGIWAGVIGVAAVAGRLHAWARSERCRILGRVVDPGAHNVAGATSIGGVG